MTAAISLEERRRRGNPGKRPQPKRPQFPVEAPEKPDDLDPIAEREWERIVPTLLTRQMLAPTDYGSLVGYCFAVSLAHRARLELSAAESLTEPSTRGHIKKHPAFQMWRDAETAVLQHADKLGLNHKARQSTKVPEVEDDAGDDLDP